jgi:hypothetical protein
MLAYKPTSDACDLQRVPDYRKVTIITLQSVSVSPSFWDALSLAEEAAVLTLGENILLSWHEQDCLFAHTQPADGRDYPDAVPGYADYAVKHGARLMVDIDDGRFVFFFRPMG